MNAEAASLGETQPDRVVVFRGGEIMGEVRENMSEEAVVALMFEHAKEPGAA